MPILHSVENTNAIKSMIPITVAMLMVALLLLIEGAISLSIISTSECHSHKLRPSFINHHSCSKFIKKFDKPIRSSRLNMLMGNPQAGISFGNKLDINIQLPTRDPALVTSFLQNTSFVIESSWDKKMLTRKQDGSYIMKLKPIVIPGIDTLSPEMDVSLEYHDGTVKLSSGRFSILSSALFKDSQFMNSLDIKINGQIGFQSADVIASSLDKGKLLVARGWVDYRVNGKRPGIFKYAPSIIMYNTIDLIKSRVQEYAVYEFSNRFRAAFKEYLLMNSYSNAVQI